MKRDANILRDGYAFSPKAQAIISIGGKPDDATSSQEMHPRDDSTNEWSDWGDDNLFPQNVLTDLDKNTIGHRALDKRRRVHFGRGIVPYREEKPNHR